MDSPVESGDQRYRFEEEKKNVFFRAWELKKLPEIGLLRMVKWNSVDWRWD